MNEKITNEKQNIEKIYQEQLKENAEQVVCFFTTQQRISIDF
jgi:hypothetical protein